MEITVNVHAPELARAIEALAAAIGQARPPRFEDGGIIARPTLAVAGQAETAATQAPLVQTTATPTAPAPSEQPPQLFEASAAVPIADTATKQNAPADKPAEEIPREVVRAKLAELSRAGKQAQVKDLLAEFGASKLTEVDPSNYATLLAKAAELA